MEEHITDDRNEETRPKRQLGSGQDFGKTSEPTHSTVPQIDPEFRQLIPALSAEERATLEASILAEGCREPLIVWNDVLIDGHNRLEICQRHNVVFDTRRIEFPDRHAAQVWMLRNQLGRRNLTDAQRIDLALLLKSEIQIEAQARRKAGTNLDPNLDQGRTRDKIADLAGVSRGTVHSYERVKASGAPELIEAVKAGDVAISRGAEIAKLPQEKQREAVKSHRQKCATGNFEWYTPNQIVEAARRTMGSIDTDPASCARANETVKAATYYTVKQDGLKHPWRGNVFLNPPYKHPIIREFCEAVVAKYESGEITQAITITNNTTETQAGQTLLRKATATCFHSGRVLFVPGKRLASGSPTQGQMICYFGPHPERFREHFEYFGAVLVSGEVAA